MGVSKGGQSGNQSGTSTTNSSFNNQGESASVNGGQTTTNQTQTQTGKTTSDQSGGFTNGVVDNVGYGDFWKNNAPTTAGDQSAQYFSDMTARDSNTLGNLAARAAAKQPGYESYAAPVPVTAQSAAGGTGAAAMAPYQTTLNNDYVNASLDDFDSQAARGNNALRAANADAFANKRTGVAQGVYQADSDKNRANLAAGLNLNAYNTAAGYGQQDATRQATVDAANADRAVQANEFNNTMTNQRQQFDVNAAYQGDQERDNAAQALANTQFSQAGANNAYLAAGSPLLGQTGTTHGNTTGTSSVDSTLQSVADSLGFNLGATNDSGNAQSTTTSNSHSNSKGGGASLG